MLRDYQEDLLNKLKIEMTKYNGVCAVLPCRSGKSYIMEDICRSAQKKNSHVLILAHRNILLDQHRDLINYPNVRICSVFTEANHLGENGPVDLIIIDECVTGDTEILTDEGYKKISLLSKKEKIAQYNENGTIEFVKPLEYIEKNYDGDMYRVNIANKKTINMSPHHVQPFYYSPKKQIKEEYIKDMKFNYSRKLIVSGKGVGIKEHISSFDKLAILSQADGTLQGQHSRYNYWTIQLKKERKIKRFIEIMNECGIEWKEIKMSKGKRRFSYKTPLNITKLLTSYFKLEEMSESYCKEFIEEISVWDGYTYKNKSQEKYYSSIIEENASFVAAVGILGGYRVNQVYTKDNRKETFSDYYRVYLLPNTYTTDTQKCSKEKYHYQGKIYCVKVPSQKIILRANGYSFVSGNCHISGCKSYQDVCEYYNCKIIGFTATPSRLDGKPLNLFQKLVIGISANELIQRKAISDYDLYAPKVNIDLSKVTIGDGDYSTPQLEKIMCDRKIYGDVIKYYKQLADNKQAIAYCTSVKHSQQICQLFNDNGYPARHMDANTPAKERDLILQEFKNGGIKIICCVNIISEGITLPTCEVGLLLRPTQSLALYIQQACRALTPVEGKKAIIIDYTGNCFRHGKPTDNHEWSLTEKVKCSNPSGEPEVLARQCSNCLRVYPGKDRICPYCGCDNGKTKQQIKAEQDAELQRIEEIHRKERRMEVGRSKSFDELIKICKERGYAPGWIIQQSKIKHIPMDWAKYNKLKKEIK